MSTPPFFGDLAKSASDLFNKGFDLSHSLATKNNANNGQVTVESGVKSTCKGQDGYSKLKFKKAPIGDVIEAEVHTAAFDSKTNGSIKWSGLVKGLDVTASGTALPDAKVKAKYSQEYVAVEGSINTDFESAKINASVVVGFEGVSVGGTAAVGMSSKGTTLKGYDAGISYKHADTTAAIITSKTLSVYTASVHHKVCSDLSAGASLKLDGDDKTVAFASTYKIDKDTTFKAKVCSKQSLTTSIEHRLANPAVKFSLASQWDFSKGGDCCKASKWGMGLVFGDY